jgi:hypothetical protein
MNIINPSKERAEWNIDLVIYSQPDSLQGLLSQIPAATTSTAMIRQARDGRSITRIQIGCTKDKMQVGELITDFARRLPSSFGAWLSDRRDEVKGYIDVWSIPSVMASIPFSGECLRCLCTIQLDLEVTVYFGQDEEETDNGDASSPPSARQ